MMRRQLLLGLLFGLSFTLEACGNGVPAVTPPGGTGAGGSCELNTDCATGSICVHSQCVAFGGSITGNDAGGTPAGDGGVSHDGLPCDVATLLQTRCDSCHSSPPTGGAPMALLTYSDLMAPSRANSSVTEAQQSVVRMTSTTAPMPASGLLPSSDVAILQDWINAGSPQGSCQPSVPDAGLPDTPPQCTSGTYWRGNESSTMRPGEACINCHQTTQEAPQYTIAGTVFPTVHEPNDCNGGTNGGAQVVITDAAGHSLTLTPNSAGNFFSQTRLTAPIHASVQRNGLTRAMVSSPPSGDCNSCHTQNGASNAPGRIVPP